MSEKYRFDINRAKSSSQKMTLSAYEMQRVFTKLNSTLSEQSAPWWVGDSKDKYKKLAYELLDELKSATQLAAMLGTDLLDIAKKKEEENKELRRQMLEELIQKWISGGFGGSWFKFLDGSDPGVSAGYRSSILGWESDAELSAKWDIKDGEMGLSAEGSLEGYLAKGEVNGQYGLASGSAAGSVGTVGIKGEAKALLFSDGKLNPSLSVKAEAEAKGLTGTLNGRYGTDQFNVFGEVEGTVGYANASAGASVSKDGISAKAEVGAAAIKGEAKTGFSFFGIKVELEGEAELLSAGAKAELKAGANSFEVGGKLSFLAGIGLKLKISW